MTKRHGYLITIKAFVPSSKTDFKAQIAALGVMDALTTSKTLSPEFLALAEVTGVAAKQGSVEGDAPAKGGSDVDA